MASPVSYYTGKISAYHDQLKTIKVRSDWLSRIRVGIFLLGAYIALHVYQAGTVFSVPGALLAIDFIAFVVAAGLHERLAGLTVSVNTLLLIHNRQVARIERKWKEIEPSPIEVPQESRILAKDLDVVGTASLAKLVDNTATSCGHDVLIRWLTCPPDPEEVVERQQAVKALATAHAKLEEWYLVSRLVGEARAGVDALTKWTESGGWMVHRPLLSLLGLITPIIAWGAFIGGIAGFFPGFEAAMVFLGVVFVQLIISVAYTGSIHDQFHQIGRNLHEVRRFQRLIELAMTLPAKDAPMISRLQQSLDADDRFAAEELHRLTIIMTFALARQNPILGILYLPLQLSMLWDLQMMRWLEKWQRRNHAHVRGWFEAIAQLESLSSMATLCHDHPEWSFPTVDSQQQRLEATGLGHQLLSSDSVVANDVIVGPVGTCLLVTGSNMSGNSTLLRSIGLNILLAQAGAPVCAKSLALPPCKVATSMRVHDSLEDGVSFYMAELLRLKQIVDDARQLHENPLQLFFLLDEILQGTNSAERHIAVANVVSHLIEHGAIGAISTHDLELANHDKLRKACQPVYFREQLVADDRRMIFDYKLQAGVAPTTNALVLLEMVGLLKEEG